MNSIPLISIITVVFNGEKYLQQTIDSVANQTYKNIEYIIIDGGSTDNTINIVKQNQHKITKWISEPDKGLYDAMNKGISLAKGELIGIINSDDWFELNAVEVVVDAYKNNPNKRIFHGDINEINNYGERNVKKYKPSIWKLIYYGMTFNHPTMFVSKREYLKHCYNINLKVLSDYQFVLESFLGNRNQFFYIPYSYVNFRTDGISSRMTLKESLNEGYLSRKNAGLNIFKNLLSVLIRFNLFMYYKIKNLS